VAGERLFVMPSLAKYVKLSSPAKKNPVFGVYWKEPSVFSEIAGGRNNNRPRDYRILLALDEAILHTAFEDVQLPVSHLHCKKLLNLRLDSKEKGSADNLPKEHNNAKGFISMRFHPSGI
jgi:hypothetical protein